MLDLAIDHPHATRVLLTRRTGVETLGAGIKSSKGLSSFDLDFCDTKTKRSEGKC